MAEYLVIYEGRVRETYLVTADSEREAREIWSDYEPISYESVDGEVVAVTLDE